MKKELFSKIRCALFFIFLYASWIIPCFMKYVDDNGTPKQEEMIECTEDIIRWRIDDSDVTIEELDIETTLEPQMISLGEFKLTAYCPCMKCCNKNDGITSTGTQATEGRTVAVDPSVIPYGTILVIVIDGQEYEYVAEDCGGAIKGNDIDIFFQSHEYALDFGIKYAEVFIKEKNIPTQTAKSE